MAKKKSGSLVPGKRIKLKGRYLPDSEIDYSDAPAWTVEELEKAALERRVRLGLGRPRSGRPWKKVISIRMEQELLNQIRELAKKDETPYQTWIHEVLQKAVKRKKASGG